MVRKKSSVVFTIMKGIILALFLFVFILPFWLMITASFETNKDFTIYGYSLYVHSFSLAAYQKLFSDSQFWQSLFNSVWVTIVTVIISVSVNTLTAYVLHEKMMPFHKFFNALFVFSMFFNAGMIPTYLVIKSLGLYNTFWALILPSSLSVYNILLIRNYMYSLPQSMEEAAMLDGANHLQIFTKVIVPVSMPIIMTTMLMTLVFKWNSWMDVLLYIDFDKVEMRTVQFYISRLQEALMASDSKDLTGEAVRSTQVVSAAIVVTVLPVILVFPFMQKYFASGLTLGAVKG